MLDIVSYLKPILGDLDKPRSSWRVSSRCTSKAIALQKRELIKTEANKLIFNQGVILLELVVGCN